MIEEKVLIDRETLKAIAVDTRLNILKLLAKKKYTLSDLSEMLGLGNSTVKEHMDNLIKAELAEKEQTERKWKFYSITLKGRRLVEPREIKVLFMFAASFVAAVGFGVWFVKKYLIMNQDPVLAGARSFAVQEAAEDMIMAAPQAAEAVGGGAAAAVNPWIIFAVMMLFTMLSAFLLGYYMKKKIIIIQKREKK